MRQERVDQGIVLNPGLLRHQITWQRKNVVGRNDFGEDFLGDPPWLDVAVCRVQIKELEGRELEYALQRFSEARYEILQHFIPNLKRVHRGVWVIRDETRYLDIVGAPDPVGTGLYQKIYAKEWEQ